MLFKAYPLNILIFPTSTFYHHPQYKIDFKALITLHCTPEFSYLMKMHFYFLIFLYSLTFLDIIYNVILKLYLPKDKYVCFCVYIYMCMHT